MSRLKLPMTAASIYTHSHGRGHGHQLVATTTTAAAGTATKLVIKPKPKPKPFITLYSRVPPVVIYKRGEWRLVPCAPHIPSAHVNNPPKTLGFRGLHNKCSFPFSFSSERKGGRVFSSSGSESGSGSSGSGLAVDMGAEDKDNNDLLQQQQQQQQQQHHHTSKLLTLPTVLTLGRVAAVPLLISSMCIFLLFCCGKVFAFEIGAVFEKWGCVVLGWNDPIGVRLKKKVRNFWYFWI